MERVSASHQAPDSPVHLAATHARGARSRQRRNNDPQRKDCSSTNVCGYRWLMRNLALGFELDPGTGFFYNKETSQYYESATGLYYTFKYHAQMTPLCPPTGLPVPLDTILRSPDAHTEMGSATSSTP